MADLSKYRSLSSRERSLVAIAVLLDGHDAAQFLSSDKTRALALARAARDLAELSPELRLPLLGTLLREALQEIQAVPSNEAGATEEEASETEAVEE